MGQYQWRGTLDNPDHNFQVGETQLIAVLNAVRLTRRECRVIEGSWIGEVSTELPLIGGRDLPVAIQAGETAMVSVQIIDTGQVTQLQVCRAGCMGLAYSPAITHFQNLIRPQHLQIECRRQRCRTRLRRCQVSQLRLLRRQKFPIVGASLYGVTHG